MRLLGLFFLLAGAALAGEYAVLASGARLHIDRHEADGAKVRLFHGTGFVEMDAILVRGFEAEEYGEPVPAVPVRAVAAPAAAAGAVAALPPTRWNWRTPPPTDTVCRGNWCAA